MKSNKKISKLLWLDYVAVAIIVIAFFVISYCGYFMGDDIYMNYGVSTLSDVFEHTKMFYHSYGGRLFSVALQYLFSGVLGNNRIWFDIVNTLFFVFFITICGKMIGENNRDTVFCVLLFALLFWFLCPIPSETLFWTASAITYLWANTLSFIFLWSFLKYKNDDFSLIGKLGLLFMSIFAATEFITCVSICGAFVVYYAFHIKAFKGNAVPFVIGFVVGSIFLLCAPGNFKRMEFGEYSILEVKYLMNHIVLEIIKYKVFWLLLIALVWGWIKNNGEVKRWLKSNSILLLSLGWSVIAFSVVFRPDNRALFFTESLSLVLVLKFLFDNYGIIKTRFINELSIRNISIFRSVIMILLFVMFIVDSAFAVVETKDQSDKYDKVIEKLVDSKGILAGEFMPSFHRMAYAPIYPNWMIKPLSDKYGLDTICIYPFYCIEDFIKKDFFSDDIFITDYSFAFDNDLFRKQVRIIVRIDKEYLQQPINHITFTIDYTRPKKWYKSWMDRWRNYQYDRTAVVERDKPDVCCDGYCYYVIWLGRENAKNLKSVKYEIE